MSRKRHPSHSQTTGPSQTANKKGMSRRTALKAAGFMAAAGWMAWNFKPGRTAAAGSPPAEAIVVDEGGGVGSFTRNGPPALWWTRRGDSFQNGQMAFTYNTNFPPSTRTNWGIWQSPPLAAGNYQIFVYIPLENAMTTGALYRINGVTNVGINQVTSRGKWVGLGTYAYNEGDVGQVYLDDVVPETLFASTRIAYDAVVWLPAGVSWEGEPDLLPYDPAWAEFGARLYAARRGDPVSTSLGSYFMQHQDLFVPGVGLNVEFKRAYNSLDTRKGAFGLGSTYTYGMSAVDRGNGEVIVTFADGRAGLYIPDGDGYTAPKGFLAELTKDGDQLKLTEVDGTVYQFRVNGDLVSVTDANSNRLTLDHDKQGFTLTDTVGRTFRANTNADGYIKEIQDPIGRKLTYDYDGDMLVTFHDAEGGTITYGYDGDRRLTTIKDPNSHTFVTNHYDAQGRVDSQKDASGSTTTFAYQESPRRTVTTDNLGNTTTDDYDDQFRLVKETDMLGYSLMYDYDADNNRIYIKDRGGHETFLTYDERGNVTESRDALSQVTTWHYNDQSRPTYKRDATGAETILEYDSTGLNLKHVHDAEGGDTWMEYDAHGLRLKLTNPNGKVTLFTYDAQGNVQTLTDAETHLTQFQHDGVGRRVKMTDANSHVVQFEYDQNDRVRIITDPKVKQTRFDYDPVGNLTNVTDRRGFSTSYQYNENDSLLKTVNPRHHAESYTYDAMYHRRTLTNRRGHVTGYEYDAVYNLKKVIDAKGNPTLFEYDPDRNVVRVTDALLYVTTYEYDELHRVKKMVDAERGVTEYTYDAVGRVRTRKDPNGAVTEFRYDRLGRLLTQVDALGKSTDFTYDPVGNRLTLTNARHNTIRFGYNAINQMIERYTPLGNRTQWNYDGVGNVLQLTDPRGNVTTFEYDQNDNAQKVTDALSGTVVYTYDEEDHRLSVTDQNGHTRAFTYDELGNPLSVRLPLGQITNFTFDQNSNRITVTNAKGKTTKFAYDKLDLLGARTSPLGFVTRYAYDELRRLKRLTDAEGNPTLYGYDGLHRLTEVKDALFFRTRYQYDAVGNLLSHLDANNHETTFKVDLLGRVTDEVNPESNAWAYGYDVVGNRVRRQDANGAVTTYEFDNDDRLTRIHYPTGQDVIMGYDPNNNLITLNDASGSFGAAGASAFRYDALNRLTEAARTAGVLAGKVLSYAYDPAGNRTRIGYPDQDRQVDYAYNENDWLVKLTDGARRARRETTYAYDPVGLPVRLDYPNKTWADYAYDDDDRLTRLFNGKQLTSTNIISSFEYTLDKVGNRRRTVEQETRGQAVTWTKDYTYDALYRLKSAVETPNANPYQILTSTFEYDKVGNRLKMVTNIADKPNTPALPGPMTLAYTYDKSNRLLSLTETPPETEMSRRGTGLSTLTYNANGNRTRYASPDRVIDYVYDYENRLIGATTYDVTGGKKLRLDATLDFAYDGLGRRVERGIKERGVRKVEDFLYDALGYDLLGEYRDPAQPLVTYYYRDLHRVLSSDDLQGNGNGMRYYHHHDGLGNVSAWTNHAGHEVQEYTYAPYGRLIDNNGADNSSNATGPHNSLTFSDKMWDRETELYHFGARDYDSKLGVWLTQDPYRGRREEPMTLHRYMYVSDNPVNWVDKYGFETYPSPGPAPAPIPVPTPTPLVSSSRSTYAPVCVAPSSSQMLFGTKQSVVQRPVNSSPINKCDGGTCTVYGYTMSCTPWLYSVDFKDGTRKFTEADKQAIRNRVSEIGQALADLTFENDTPEEAFSKAFNLKKNEKITFVASSEAPGYWGENTAHNQITIYKGAKADTEGFVAHELGHVFDNNRQQAGRNELQKASIKDAAGKKVESNQGYSNRQSKSTNSGEYFADMFQNWVYGYEDSPAGDARREWMDQEMNGWVNRACVNNQ